MVAAVDYDLVEQLMDSAGATDDEVVQLVLSVGIEPVLRTMFAELLIDLGPVGWGADALRIQYDLAVSRLMHRHLLTWRDGALEVTSVRRAPAGVPAPPAPDGRIHLRHTLVDFLELFRSVFGATAARDRHRALAAALAAASCDDGWLPRLDRRAAEHGDLRSLSARFGSEKWGVHYYAGVYERLFQPFRDRRLKVLEIGVGGCGNPAGGGASLQMWRRYFPRASVYGIDVVDKSALDGQRIKTFAGSQNDSQFLEATAARVGPFDIVIDDGSHISRDVIASFTALFPYLRNGGLYVIEDLAASYWPGFGGSSDDLNRPDTAMGYLKTLVDGMNYEERLPAG